MDEARDGFGLALANPRCTEVARKRARIANAAVAKLLASMRSDGQEALDLWGGDPDAS